MKSKHQHAAKCNPINKGKHASTILIYSILTIQIASGVTNTDGVNLGTSNTVPTASNSIASGSGNTATESSVAMGYGNLAENYSFALGEGSAAYWGSIAGGGWNTLDTNSYYMTALGEGNYSGYSGSSVLLGTYNSMGLQWGSAAIGNSNMMQFPFGKSGTGNVLLGQFNRIDAMVSISSHLSSRNRPRWCR
jgi:predicted anti-sigma-YlaC factor YlaD